MIIQYPIQIPDGNTIYVHGNFAEAGTDEWFAERDRLQELYRASVENEEVVMGPGGPIETITPAQPIDWALKGDEDE
jgi:hypothetical protein